MLHIILYHPEIPQNTGNILRTAAAINAHVHVIGPLPFDIDAKSLKRAGMDYIDERNYTLYPSYEDFNRFCPAAKIYYITRYGHHVYTQPDFSSPIEDYFVMFGRESTGIDYALLEAHLNRTLRIPMRSTARSLNLANTVAIVCYEILRQQNFVGLATQEQLKGPDFLK